MAYEIRLLLYHTSDAISQYRRRISTQPYQLEWKLILKNVPPRSLWSKITWKDTTKSQFLFNTRGRWWRNLKVTVKITKSQPWSNDVIPVQDRRVPPPDTRLKYTIQRGHGKGTSTQFTIGHEKAATTKMWFVNVDRINCMYSVL